VTSRLHWDGRYLWALTESAVVVLDPRQGEACRFEDEEVVHGSNLLDGRLSTLEPGRACFIGYVMGDAHAPRSWVNLLNIERQKNHTLRGRSETLVEIRGTEGFVDSRKMKRPMSAGRPRWAKTIYLSGEPLHPIVLASVSASGVWIIAPDTRTVSRIKIPWPSGAMVMPYHDVLYVASGVFDGTRNDGAKHFAYLSRLPDVQEPFELLIETAEYDATALGRGGSQYFSTAAVYDGKLHGLVASKEMMHKINGQGVKRESEPSWIVFDLQTLHSYMLVSSLENEIPRSLEEQLIVSSQFGLVLVTGGTAYQVTLPPVETWPALEATVHPEGLKVKMYSTGKPEPLTSQPARTARKPTSLRTKPNLVASQPSENREK